MTQIVGWVSSSILFLTVATQVWRQHRSGGAHGVSEWLYVGQMAASIGFTFYSWLLSNWIFIATNATLALAAFVGCLIQARQAASRPVVESELCALGGSRHSRCVST